MDAIHLDKSMNNNFTVYCKEQRRVANGFKNISTSEYDNCAGYIDGLLIWTFNPNEKNDIVSEVGAKNFTAGKIEILV